MTESASKSLWMELQIPLFYSLDENVSTDVCIVGAGIVGLTCAYTLLKQGKSVVVLEQGHIGVRQTGHTTAHLTWALDERYFELEKIFGNKGAKLALESHSAAIDYIEKIINDEKIDCDFERVDGYLFNPPGSSEKNLDRELKALAKIGKKINKIPRAPWAFDTGPCLHFPRQAQFHILKYLKGLVEAIQRNGGKIFCNTHASHFQDSPCVVNTSTGALVTSQSIIVATDTPVNNRFYIHTKQAPYQTYVIAARVPKGSVTTGLYWDTEDSYHYIRIQKDSDFDWLIIGGEDHKTGQSHDYEARYARLENWAKERFPVMEEVGYRWSGQVFEPIDSLGFIGKNPGDQNTYIATGDSGNGMTHGTIAGMLIPDLIMGKENHWKDLYDPSRKTLKAASNFIEENLNVAWQYRDWFTPGELQKVEMLSSEEGIILRDGLNKLCVYKDKDNEIYVNSAFCPHLGGCVRWNSFEKCWDCPCHGSQFCGKGKVINGPANCDLTKKLKDL